VVVAAIRPVQISVLTVHACSKLAPPDVTVDPPAAPIEGLSPGGIAAAVLVPLSVVAVGGVAIWRRWGSDGSTYKTLS
jgi:hypothetical protein